MARKLAADTSLEQSLANVAYSKLSDKAPKLFDFVKGFQLLDQSDDRKRAVGLFGFQIGDKIFRVPIFYRDGQVFGTELLMPDHRTFRPLTDHWVQYLTSREADSPGDPVTPNTRQVGPSLWQLSVPPTKWASANPDAAKALAEVRKSAGAKPEINLLLDAVRSNRKLAGAFQRLRAEYPWFEEGVRKFYGKEAADRAVAETRRKWDHLVTRDRSKRAIDDGVDLKKKPAKPKLVVIRVTTIKSVRFPDTPTHLTGEERKLLFEGHNVYRDSRPSTEVSEVIAPEKVPGDRKMQTPGANGVYDVYMPSGKAERCVVAGPPLVPGGGGDDCVVVVRLSDKAAVVAHRSRVFALGGRRADGEWREFLESGAKVDSAGDVPGKEDGKGFVLTTPDGRVVAPLRKLDGEGNHLRVVPACDVPDWTAGFPWTPRRNDLELGNPPWDRPGYQHSPHRLVNAQRRTAHPYDVFPEVGYVKTVMLCPETCEARERNDVLTMPKGARCVSVKVGDDFRPQWDYTPAMVQSKVKEAADTGGHPALEVHRVDGDLRVLDPRRGHRPGPVKLASDVEADLVESHGLAPAAARELVKAALETGRVRVGVKYANPYLATPLKGEDPGQVTPQLDRAAGGVGPLPGDLQTVRPAEMEVAVPSLSGQAIFDPYDPDMADQHLGLAPLASGQGGPSGGGPARDKPGFGSGSSGGGADTALQAASAAVRGGAKDMFDSAALAVLLKYTSVDTVVNQLLPKTLDYVNHLGRTLAHLYWNSDKYGERYGRAEVATMADRIRDLFEKCGDLYLVFRERRADDMENVGLMPGDDSAEQDGGSAM